MSGRYVRNVQPGERWDPTMTGVEVVQVFHEGDYIRYRDGLSLITQIDDAPFGKPDTRFLHLVNIRQVLPGSTVHDLRENDARNFYYNGMMNNGRAPADVMSFEEAKRLYEQALNNSA